MSNSKLPTEILKRKIIESFAAVSSPKGVIALHECDECRELRKTFANQNWKTLDSKILEENYDKLPLFALEAFHCFLPAFLIYSLDHFKEQYNEVPEFTVYGIAPNKTIKENPTWWQERFKYFTFEQFIMIYEFLDLAKQNKEFEYFITQIERGKERLKEFVEPTIKEK